MLYEMVLLQNAYIETLTYSIALLVIMDLSGSNITVTTTDTNDIKHYYNLCTIHVLIIYGTILIIIIYRTMDIVDWRSFFSLPHNVHKFQLLPQLYKEVWLTWSASIRCVNVQCVP